MQVIRFIFLRLKLCAFALTSVFVFSCIVAANFDLYSAPKRKSANWAVDPNIRQPIEASNHEVQCIPKRHFVYIKTHKTGSTTLYKVVDNHRRHQKLKKTQKQIRPFLGGYPGHIDFRFVYVWDQGSLRERDPKRDRDAVFMDHFRYSPHMKSEMPQDTKYFTILRNPWSHFQSAFHYYYGNPTYNPSLRETCFKYPFYQVSEGHHNVSIIEYLHKTEKNLNSSVPWFFRSRNYQSFDLGLDPFLEDPLKIHEEVQRLSNDLDLVLITDYFDESLVLLKELFCMEWEDLLYEYDTSSRQYKSVDLKDFPEAEKIFNKLYRLDTSLYEHFNDTLWRKVNAYGRGRMEEDVAKLRKMRTRAKQRGQRDTTGSRTNAFLSPEREETIFRAVNLRRSPVSMKGLLVRKLRKLYDMDHRTSIAMAEYMVDNNGGCPI